MRIHITVKKLLASTLLASCVCTHGLIATAQERSQKGSTFSRSEPNLYAPGLYADNLRIKVTLINLPGAGDPQSNWEGAYQLYFVSEAEFQKVVKQLPPGGYSLRPDQFPNKILLAKGTFKKAGLSSLQDRTYIQSDVAFKSRVPDSDRTKAARLITSYSVKIFDAKLKSPIYRSGVFLTHPFDDTGGADKAVPRGTIYLNFFVSPEGQLFYSQWARETNDTNW